jgi:hypothetical protein
VKALELSDYLNPDILPNTAEVPHDQLVFTLRELERAKEDYGRAAKLVADMHAAAVGEVRGPIRGVVEDVADLRAELGRLEECSVDGIPNCNDKGQPDSEWCNACLLAVKRQAEAKLRDIEESHRRELERVAAAVRIATRDACGSGANPEDLIPDLGPLIAGVKLG